MTVDEVNAPPELLTMVVGPSSDTDVVCVGEVPVDGSGTVDGLVAVEGFDAGEVAGSDDPPRVVPSDGESADDSDGDETELDSSASATPGVLPTKAATPNAAANAPTRPIYLAYPILAPPTYTNIEFAVCLPGT